MRPGKMWGLEGFHRKDQGRALQDREVSGRWSNREEPRHFSSHGTSVGTEGICDPGTAAPRRMEA